MTAAARRPQHKSCPARPLAKPRPELSADQLFQKNKPWAETIARNVVRKLPPSFESADVTQEALLELWKRAQLYEANNGLPGKDPSGTPFQAYAYLAVRGACLMAVRRRNWTEATHLSLDETENAAGETIVPEPASPTPDPETKLAKKRERKNVSGPREYRRRRWLLKEIDKLSPVDAHLITQTYIKEVDLDALAKLAGVERSVLSRRLAGIVKRLKKARRKTTIVFEKEEVRMVDIDYSAVVADLEAKCTKADAAIAGLEKLRATRKGIVAAIAALRKMMGGAKEAAVKK